MNVSIEENGTAVHIFMAENDAYCGCEKARSAYSALQTAYRDIQMSKSMNAWLWKFPIANTLTAVAFITTTETEISFLTAKIF